MINNSFVLKNLLSITVIIYLLVYTTASIAVSLNRFHQYDVFYYDHGLFDKSLWQVSKFKSPIFDHLEDGMIHQLGDHWNPVLYILSPLYWLTSSYDSIFYIQNLLVCLSALILFFIGKRHIANPLMLFAIMVSYTGFIGLQNLLISGFHPEFLALVSLSLCLYFLDRKQWLWYWIFLLITLQIKETFAIIGFALSFYLFIVKESKQALITIMLSILTYLLAIKVGIPYFGQRPFFYHPEPISPIQIPRLLFYPFIKTETMFVSTATFGFLPLVALAFLPVIGQDFFLRFVLNGGSARWDLGMHYNATLAVLLCFAAILGVKALLRFRWYKKIITLHAFIILITVCYFHQVKYHGPLGLAINPDFYRHTQDFSYLDDYIKQVPSKGIVMASNNLAPHLTHSDSTIMLLKTDYWKIMPDVIVFDKRKGQNPNNHWPVMSWDLENFTNTIQNDTNYRQISILEDQLIFIKKHNADIGIYASKNSK